MAGSGDIYEEDCAAQGPSSMLVRLDARSARMRKEAEQKARRISKAWRAPARGRVTCTPSSNNDSAVAVDALGDA
jgi:hypothetical protein